MPTNPVRILKKSMVHHNGGDVLIRLDEVAHAEAATSVRGTRLVMRSGEEYVVKKSFDNLRDAIRVAAEEDWRQRQPAGNT